MDAGRICLQHLILRCCVSEKSEGMSLPSARPMHRVCSQFPHLSHATMRSPSSVTVPQTHLQDTIRVSSKLAWILTDTTDKRCRQHGATTHFTMAVSFGVICFESTPLPIDSYTSGSSAWSPVFAAATSANVWLSSEAVQRNASIEC